MIFHESIGGGMLDRLRVLGPGGNPRAAPMVRVIVECLAEPDGQLERLRALAEDADPTVAAAASLWISHN